MLDNITIPVEKGKVKMRLLSFLLFLAFSFNSFAREISFTTKDNATIYADFQPAGSHAVLLAHGAIFNKSSWGEFVTQLLANNYTVLAIDFRGHGKSSNGKMPNALYQDILAGVHFLQIQTGINKVSVLGASIGGGAAAKASVLSVAQDIDSLILLSPASIYHPEQLKGNLLFIASEDEYLSKIIQQSYNKAPSPKRLVLIPGRAHAQHIFKTAQADAMTAIILDFLE